MTDRPTLHVLALLVALAATSVATTALAEDFFVSPQGDDAAPGSDTEPWRTIQKAADTVPPGSTVFIAPGIYRERVRIRVSGSEAAGFTTFRSFEGAPVVIDGAGLPQPVDDNEHLILIDGRSWVRVQGLQLRNHRTTRGKRLVTGIYVTSESAPAHHIEILGNVIHDIENRGRRGGNAHAIGVFGARAEAITDVVVARNVIHDCRLGQSEALVINGNVDGFSVADNVLHDLDNIAIDVIGHEDTAPSDDQARNGVVGDNVVLDVTSLGNPGYPNERSAGGIYVDGGRDLVVERNIVRRCDLGVEVASERKGRTTSGVVVRENLLQENHVSGLALGGFDPKRGTTVDCVFEHNTLIHNDTTRSGAGEIMLQVANGNVIRHNLVLANDQALVLGNYFKARDTFDNTFDFNLWFADGGAPPGFVFKRREVTGLAAFRTASGQGVNSVEADPLLTVSPFGDVSAHAGSTGGGVDAGDLAFAAAPGETDLDGYERVAGARVDIGATEFGSTAAVFPQVRFATPRQVQLVEGRPFRHVVLVHGADPEFGEPAADRLPFGVTFDPATRTLRGTPTERGFFEVNVSAFGAAGPVFDRIFLQVEPDPVADPDGDGFPKELEDRFGPLDWEDDQATPLGAPPIDERALAVAKLVLALDFARSGKDKLTLRGSLALDAAPAPGPLTLYVAGVVRTFEIDASGRSPKSKQGGVTIRAPKNGAASMKLTLKKEDLQDALFDDGLRSEDLKRPKTANRTLPVILLLGDTAHRVDVPIAWGARLGGKGKAKSVAQ